jgi:beta-glucanase (GH16 family)
MRLWRKLGLGVPLVGAVVLSGAGLPGPLHGSGSPALAASSGPTAQGTRPAGKVVAPPKGKPAFSATFSGTSLNTKVWQTCYPEWDGPTGCRNFGNPQEAEWYLPGQDRVSGGVLHLVAQRKKTEGLATPTGPAKEYDCRSGMISSYPSLQFQYGFIQVVANVPHKLGLWPALWLAAANLQYPPEMDLLESWGVNALTAAFFHPLPEGTYRDRGLIPLKLATGWQTYSLSWTPKKMIFYVGDTVVLTVTQRVPHQHMYFVANLAEYEPAAKGYCSGQLEIRSVKYWKN